ncbi:hypothetical protein PInf_024536 [Phytophthora infestans]|nr:hypothetical protein PInf_024536 [Phytophthora infestans]
MWNVPPGALPLEEDIMFNTVDLTIIVDDYAEQEKKNASEKLSVVDLFTVNIIPNLGRLRELMLKKKLAIQVHYGVVKAERLTQNALTRACELEQKAQQSSSREGLIQRFY